MSMVLRSGPGDHGARFDEPHSEPLRIPSSGHGHRFS
jgi:hypothetical protein